MRLPIRLRPILFSCLLATQGYGAEPPRPAVGAEVCSSGQALDAPGGLEKDIDEGVRCTGKSCAIDRRLVDKVLAHTTALATSARFVPAVKDGKPRGFQVYAIRPGSFFAKLGMENADLVRAINGRDISTPDKALAAYTAIKGASHLTLALERRGEAVTLDYKIR